MVRMRLEIKKLLRDIEEKKMLRVVMKKMRDMGGDILSDSSNFDSGKDSDKENSEKFRVFSQSDTYDPKFDLGRMFSSKNEFRVAVQSHAVKTRENVKITKMTIGEFMQDVGGRLAYHVKQCTSSWLGQKFEDAFRTDPGRNIKGWRHDTNHWGRWLLLKGPHWGVLLTAVSIDPNNDSFPLCYACVGGETRETWEWYLYLIKHDLHIENAHEWTFMSDKQKGLVPAFETVFPTSDNRFCVRHLHGNMKRAGFKGLAHKKALWKAASATTMGEFNARMREFAKLDVKASEWLSDKPPSQWSSVETYLRVYQYCIYPVNGPEKWKQTGGVPLLPPNLGRGVGRPPRARRMEHDEARNK
ncbi:hypothetical protein Sango_2791000 [Sesamum angolense]|uniref:MULE transposase domain-containing protein n=1 Tax=Sesamum angolense TaxID=2727404 RepID=A0AAE1VZZ1_9LAMI|nr:hypothetical protein Sango_2791000 [Sesamum angolense]